MNAKDGNDARSIRRTAELNDTSVGEVAAAQQLAENFGDNILDQAMRVGHALGLSPMTALTSLLQLAVHRLVGLHPGATATMLRCLADMIDASEAGDDKRYADATEALHQNGLAFTAAMRARHVGGRN